MSPVESNSQYFKRYRSLLGFASQGDARDFLGAKDIIAKIDDEYIEARLRRVADILRQLHIHISAAVPRPDIDELIKRSIYTPLDILTSNDMLPRLNNHGRRPEDVLFAWVRGHAIAEFFLPAVQHMFSSSPLVAIGGDDLTDPETFKRTATADYKADTKSGEVRFEIQSGFNKFADLKKHKVTEARRAKLAVGARTVCVHLDIFNGRCGFVRVDGIDPTAVEWVKRRQFESQEVMPIAEDRFLWRLSAALPTNVDRELEL